MTKSLLSFVCGSMFAGELTTYCYRFKYAVIVLLKYCYFQHGIGNAVISPATDTSTHNCRPQINFVPFMGVKRT